jgi:hypothetical protein
MNWARSIWDQWHARIGVFTVMVEQRSDGWTIDVGGIKAKARYKSADAAKADAPRLAKAWLTKALAELSEAEKT